MASARGYFAWNSSLENFLIECLVELAVQNHVKNGVFKGGAYKELENMMEVKAPGCEVKAYPHIKSRLKVLKTKFQAYQQCRNQSGWGWDNVQNCPVVDADVFGSYVQVNPNCRGLNGKPFPQYESLLMVFGNGKGRATGEGAVGANENAPPISESGFNMDASSITEEGMTRNLQNVINETFGMPTPNEVRNEQPENSSSGANSENRRARRPATRRILMESSANDLASEILEIRPAIDRAIDAMVNRLLGEDENRNNMRHQIMIDLESLPGLTRHQIIDAVSALTRDENYRDLELFYRLTTIEDRLYFIKKMLMKENCGNSA
ncbi:hypothetical protein LINGRAHAP2_LOCUS4192 [Linum grandiflorum]